MVNYEHHKYTDPSLPVIFHRCTVKNRDGNRWTHWHENIEILHMTQGTALMLSGPDNIKAQVGEIVVINSNDLHHMQSEEGTAQYDCLIIDKGLCEIFDVDIDKILFNTHIKDPLATQKYIRIKEELENTENLYNSAIKAAILDFLVHIGRNHAIVNEQDDKRVKNARVDLVKKGIGFIQSSFTQNVSTMDIAKNAGVSKYYFCRIFKEVTGVSPMVYLNNVRCINAKGLIKSGKFSVSEAAYASGFDNLSYFSRTYKRFIGCLPSETKNGGNANVAKPLF